MFLDPFTFTPPHPDVLTRAVESYQRVAASRFCRYARDAEDPDLLPRRLSGDSLEPTPKQLHAEVRALRHLTAIQRTLREIGGPLFDPDSPIPPNERFRLVDRRLDEIEDALGDGELDAPGESTIQRIVSCPQDGSASSYSELFSEDSSSRSLRPSRFEGFSASDQMGAQGSPSVEKTSFYHPPEIEDLPEAVDFAQTVFAARAELLDKRRLQLSSEDFLLEIASLRDLTAVIRTLRRMSARRLPESQTHEDLQKEIDADDKTAPAPSVSGQHQSDPIDDDVSRRSPVTMPEAERAQSADASNPSHRSWMSHDSLESGESVKSVDHPDSSSSNAIDSGRARARNGAGLVNSMGGDRPLRSVPKVPEVRPVTPRRESATPTPEPDGVRNSTTSLHLHHGAAGNEAGQDRTDPPPSSASASDSEHSNLTSEIPNPLPSHPSRPDNPPRASHKAASGDPLILHEPHPPPSGIP